MTTRSEAIDSVAAKVVPWLSSVLPFGVSIERRRSEEILITRDGGYVLHSFDGGQGTELDRVTFVQQLRGILESAQDFAIKHTHRLWPESETNGKNMPRASVDILPDESLRVGFKSSSAWVLLMDTVIP